VSSRPTIAIADYGAGNLRSLASALVRAGADPVVTTDADAVARAPLAMIACDHSVTDATLGMQWHILAMFAPSFFTGHLIARFGVERVTGAGLALLIISGLVAMAGITLWHFWSALILLGLGWNFGFIGATSMVTRCYRPEERNKVQSFNDFLIFGSLAISSLASGKLLVSYGWDAVNGVLFPVVLAAGALLLWLTLRQRPQAA